MNPLTAFSILNSADVYEPEMLIREQLFVRKGSTGAAHIPDSFKLISSLDAHTHTHNRKQCLVAGLMVIKVFLEQTVKSTT